MVADSFLAESFGDLGYAAPFLFLVGAGAGFPCPEEVTMVASGYLLYLGEVAFLPIVLTCWAATLIGDSIPYWCGHHFGKRALRWRWVAKAIHPERIALIEDRVRQHGNKAILTCRFLPGVRMPAFFTAGTMGMPYWRFLFFDALAACFMVPAYILLGRGFGENIAWIEEQLRDSTEWVGLALVMAVTAVGVRLLVRRREKQVARLEEPEGLPAVTEADLHSGPVGDPLRDALAGAPSPRGSGEAPDPGHASPGKAEIPGESS